MPEEDLISAVKEGKLEAMDQQTINRSDRSTGLVGLGLGSGSFLLLNLFLSRPFSTKNSLQLNSCQRRHHGYHYVATPPVTLVFADSNREN